MERLREEEEEKKRLEYIFSKQPPMKIHSSNKIQKIINREKNIKFDQKFFKYSRISKVNLFNFSNESDEEIFNGTFDLQNIKGFDKYSKWKDTE